MTAELRQELADAQAAHENELTVLQAFDDQSQELNKRKNYFR